MIEENDNDVMSNLLGSLYSTVVLNENWLNQENKNNNYDNTHIPAPRGGNDMLDFLKKVFPDPNSITYLSFVDPRMPISFSEEMLNFGDPSSVAQINNHFMFSKLVNMVPSSRGFYTPTGMKMPDIFISSISESKTVNVDLIEKFSKLNANLKFFERSSPIYGQFFTAYYIPGHPDKLSWTKFQYSPSDTSEKVPDRYFGGSVDSNFSMLYIDGDTSDKVTGDYSLTTEITKIPIQRPWFDVSIYHSRDWDWKIEGRELISDGEGNGVMPIYITSMILSRNLTIQLNLSQNMNTLNHINRCNSCTFGPFSVKSNELSMNIDFSNGQIRSPGLQVLGFECNKLPKSPNPDKKI